MEAKVPTYLRVVCQQVEEHFEDVDGSFLGKWLACLDTRQEGVDLGVDDLDNVLRMTRGFRLDQGANVGRSTGDRGRGQE